MAIMKDIVVREEMERAFAERGIDPQASVAKAMTDVVCAMSDEMDEFFGEYLPKSSIDTLNGNISDSANAEKQRNCYHNWNNYTGLTESYSYCSKCDAKKPVSNEQI